MQPEQVRRTWIARRGSTWWQLTRPDPLNYYAELRKLFIEHARHLASRIDSSTEGIPLIPPRRRGPRRGCARETLAAGARRRQTTSTYTHVPVIGSWPL